MENTTDYRQKMQERLRVYRKAILKAEGKPAEAERRQEEGDR